MDNPLVQLDPGLFIWTILTFLILFGALAKYAWKPLLKALENRENMIRSSIADAEK
ncbi:MAG: ATP synthase F0 subunit B, partial [Candidatus Marinimicrobia bacterium]|nr:ATP synthase F0 subunit B [Candidatus Neomarinimicrobiota bacterium]